MFPDTLIKEAFNPRFLSMGFETCSNDDILWGVVPFNPRFLSMGFETSFRMIR